MGKENFKEKNLAAVVLGRLGGLKGGKARAEKLSKERRREIAIKASQARWKRVSDKDQGGRVTSNYVEFLEKNLADSLGKVEKLQKILDVVRELAFKERQ